MTMKQLLVLILVFSLLSGSALADAPAKPYEDMTVAELKAVDTKTLSRDERRHLKKVLKAAKKAEKARIKAEKRRLKAERKAEKARIKAEKKRAKAEAKRLRKARKAATKQLALIETVYKNSGIYRDPGYSNLRIRGADAKISTSEAIFALSSNGGHVGYFIRTYFNPLTGGLSPQIYMTVSFSDVVDQDMLYEKGMTAEAMANRNGWWKNYRWAALRNGAGRRLTPVDRYSNNSPYYASFFEEYIIQLAFEDITAAVKAGTALRVEVSSPSRGAYPFTIAVSYDYLLGYLMRLSEADQRLAHMKGWANPRIMALKETLAEATTSTTP